MNHETIDSLRTRLETAERELAKQQTINYRAAVDWAEDDTHVRNAAKPFFTDFQINGDSHGVPCITDVVDLMSKELTQLQQANAELVKDRERLEGLQRLAKDHVVKFAIFENGKLDLVLAKESGEILAYHGHPDLRQAIDAAITKGTV